MVDAAAARQHTAAARCAALSCTAVQRTSGKAGEKRCLRRPAGAGRGGGQPNLHTKSSLRAGAGDPVSQKSWWIPVGSAGPYRSRPGPLKHRCNDTHLPHPPPPSPASPWPVQRQSRRPSVSPWRSPVRTVDPGGPRRCRVVPGAASSRHPAPGPAPKSKGHIQRAVLAVEGGVPLGAPNVHVALRHARACTAVSGRRQKKRLSSRQGKARRIAATWRGRGIDDDAARVGRRRLDASTPHLL